MAVLKMQRISISFKIAYFLSLGYYFYNFNP